MSAPNMTFWCNRRASVVLKMIIDMIMNSCIDEYTLLWTHVLQWLWCLLCSTKTGMVVDWQRNLVLQYHSGCDELWLILQTQFRNLGIREQAAWVGCSSLTTKQYWPSQRMPHKCPPQIFLGPLLMSCANPLWNSESIGWRTILATFSFHEGNCTVCAC